MQKSEAAGAIATAAGDAPLYQSHIKVYPQSVSGRFRRIRWAVLCVTLGIYYFLPFVRWDRGPNAPGQAVLIDFPSRRFYFFFIEIWPQEVYYFTGLLVLAALALFLMNALAGRLWCGYLCPQTVWTDLYLAIERWTEGDRRERVALDAGPWTLKKARAKAAKHALWLIVAWWTGGAWVLYFADAPTLVKDLATFQAPFIAWASIGTLTFTTYALAGFMREQLCIYMCPWPRIQGALTDEDALNVTYRFDRGEPRQSFKKSLALRSKGLPAGDCVDCSQCVVVCPTGVDIRRGLQLSCIQCGLCIDACDGVMAKLGRPTGLIGYDTDVNVRRRIDGKPTAVRLIRPRTILYAALMAIVAIMMVAALLLRTDLGVAVIHDRNPQFVRMSDGAVRNAFTVRLLNKEREKRRFSLAVDGLAGAQVEIVGGAPGALPLGVEVGPDQTFEIRVAVTTREKLPPHASVPLVFRITDAATGRTAVANDHFVGP